ncbi:UDP-N-acetylgalactosamine-undecaprenyl-phosphate N-acetylgalactosaminephosphotransferase [Candidatus Izimaplasma bacterium HR1]|jgi:lipopolysaccharide/colanic/teichoic acid biosynthesis glycosyltransferase|uniref:sugar transferase n=1 Tax=Candidatus Izimoplasma sp. HR1 TaxID=1541959 RepID=UPI0004F90750|nr:UDP-N-acetylgalactosamine-undecaprenyl-phosphate N-acetylgalactosaminephosphotransferase [Candidatus Izimaplasma bacterium HR1]
MSRKIYLLFKRVSDILVSLIGVVILLPFNLTIAIAIKVLMPGPIFFLQERIGKNGKKFMIVKYRSMKVDKSLENRIDTSKDIERTTRLGKILRRTKIDEIPQLLNVLMGDMSLIGPRPTIERQVKKYTVEQMHRLDLKPGMTGLAQVSGGTKILWEERINIDLKYIEEASIILDIKILYKTVLTVIKG